MSYEKIESGQYYHIYNRGNNKENLFKEEMNYFYFLQLMERHLLPVADIFSYCLLKNHFHLFIKVKEEKEGQQFSKAYSNMCNAYAKAINKKYERTGSLFQTRFKRNKVVEEAYMKNLIVYINLNPLYHGLTTNVYQYKHSSLQNLLFYKKSFLKCEEIWNLFGGRENFGFQLDVKKKELDSKVDEFFLE